MDKLIVMKLSAFSLFLSLFLSNFSNPEIPNEIPSEMEVATQVVKICHVNDQSYAAPVSCTDPGSINIVVDENGMGTMQLDIHAAHLIPDFGTGNYTLPSYLEHPMFIEYDLPDGGFAVTDQITQFQSENPLIDLYVSYVDLTFDFNHLCEEQNDKDQVPYTSNARLVSHNDTEVPNPPYNIQDYSNSGQVFSCSIFFETCSPDCDGPQATNCSGGGLNAEEDVYFCIQCATDDKGSPADGKSETVLQENHDNKESNSFVKVNPNPFQHFFDINYNLTESGTVNIEVFNANGNLVKQLSTTGKEGNNQIKIDSPSLENGIYYLQLSNSKNSQMIKLIKF